MEAPRSFDFSVDIFAKMRDDLSIAQIKTHQDFSSAASMINHIEGIVTEWQALTLIQNDKERETKINAITRSGLEDSPSINIMAERVSLFCLTYTKSKENDKLPEFFKCFSQGDPCLTGKFESLSEFATKQTLGFSLSPEINQIEKYAFPFLILDDFSYQCEEESLSKTKITADIFKEYLMTNISTVAEKFATHRDKTKVGKFIELLKKEHIDVPQKEVDNLDLNNWKEITTNLIDSKFGRSLLNHIIEGMV